jgi:hypothetical protein
MSDLKKLMDEYKTRINDPSYVAPKELRGGKPLVTPNAIPTPQHPQNVSALSPSNYEMMGNQIKQMLSNDPTSRADSATFSSNDESTYGKSTPNDIEMSKRFYNTPEKKELAQHMGIPMVDGEPFLDEKNDSEFDESLKHINDDKATERQKMFLDLMTDWKNKR